jgi:predicted RNA binding protein YcfA (HicA-like mRNA interferase family)
MLGFGGPFSGGRHEFLVRNNRRLILPNPHKRDISPDLLARILRQAGVFREEWEATA